MLQPIENGVSVTIPAPVGGLNSRDPLDSMDPLFALEFENWFPEERQISIRHGFESFCSGMGTGAVGSLIEHSSAAGARTLLAACDDALFNITSGTAVSLTTGLTSSRFQHVSMNNITLLFNGEDQPRQWSGSALSNATYTGISADEALIQGCNYRGRLYLLAKDDGNIYYPAARSVTGALTSFPVSYEFQRGGYPMWCTTWTRGGADSTMDVFVVCSSEGEVLVYAGLSFDIDMAIIGRLFLGKPLGRRSFLNVGSELEIITEDGVVPLSVAISDPVSGQQGSLTDKISPSFNSDARLYSGNRGWQGVVYPRGRYALYNVPVEEGGQARQYVRNLYTGAWAKFSGQSASCFATFNSALYFGGPAGEVFKSDSGVTDDGNHISTRLKFAFNYLGSREVLKKLSLIRPIITASAAMTFATGADMDFEVSGVFDTISVTSGGGANWDEEDWDVAEWAAENTSSKDWYAVTGLGRCAALKMQADVSGVSASMTAIHTIFQPGGQL